MTWQRPSSVPLPSVWAIVEGRTPLANGKTPRFRIQDVTPELEDLVVSHMQQYFISDEPYCASMNMAEDEEAKAEFGAFWKSLIQRRLCMVGLLDNPEDFVGVDLPPIAGCNMTYPIVPGEKDLQAVNGKVNSFFQYVNALVNQVDSFKKHNVGVIMHEFGCSVAPVYRRQGLGVAFMEARSPLGKAVGITVTTSFFTGAISQAAAFKGGLKVIAEIRPEQYKENGQVVFKNVNSKSVLFMDKIL